MLIPQIAFAQVWTKGTGFTPEPFYLRPASVSLHLNNYMFAQRKVATPPINFIAEVTAVKNFTAGPMLTYFQFRHSESEAINSTRWINPEIRYHEIMVGTKAEYHINHLLQRLIRRTIPGHIIDTYTAGWAGYSFVKAASALPEKELISRNEKFRGGLAVGARSLVLQWLGFSVEGGYSSYGYASFGLFFVVR